jgi:hypothetical protein
MKYAHIGIPTSEKKPDEIYIEGAKVFITDCKKSEYGVEFLRFEDDSPMPELLKTTPHVAFEVDDLQAAIVGKEMLLEPFKPMEDLTCAFIIEQGVPVELMQLG